jgi:hypothetical protein
MYSMYIVYAYKALVTWNWNKVGQRHQVWSYTWVAHAQSLDARQFGNTLRVHFTQRLGDAKSRLIVAIGIEKLLHVPHVHRRPLVWSLCSRSFLLFERSDSFRYSLRSTVLSHIMTAQLQSALTWLFSVDYKLTTSRQNQNLVLMCHSLHSKTWYETQWNHAMFNITAIVGNPVWSGES